MPPKAPLTSIECYSLSHLIEELDSIQDALSVAESEESWDSIATALNRLGALCNGNANTYPADLVSVLRASSRPITTALNSERTRLSGAATDFVTTATTALGSSFEPLVPHYLPTLLTLCTRTNKVFLNRAKACIAALVEYTQAPAIIHYSSMSISDKSVSLRLAAAETMLLCLKGFNPPDLEKESRAKEIEATIRATAVDASADVRKVGRKIFDAYKILLPRRVQSFTDPLTPRTRKYLDIKAGTAAPRSQPPSRPTSSQSVRSNHSDTRPIPASSSQPSTSTTAAAQRPVKHARSMSTSHTTSSQKAPQRPVRAPTPEVVAPSHTREGARRPPREELRRLKVDMPPPDFIPTRSADTGPQRPMSATELQFPTHHHTTSERPMSGPQRVMRADVAQPGGSSTTAAVRTGPIRPAVFSLKSEEGPTAEKKERVVGGARRVLRMPETTGPAEDKGKGKAAPAPAAPSSKPIRPRVISTSKSTPAIPLQVASAREEAAKKLASSAGASSRSGTSTKATAAAPTTKPSRTATSSTLTQPTAGSRARITEKGQVDKDKAKTKVSSKTVLSAAPRAGPGTSITVRDRAARAVSKSKPAPTKAVTKTSQRAPSKSRSSPEVPEEVPEVAPTEVPLPESPKLAPAPPSREPSPPPLISLDTPENSVALPAAPEPTTASTPTAVDPVPNPADIPLPSSTPGELSAASPSEPTIVISEPHTPTPQQRPPRRAAEVEQTPISALVASIQRGFLSMHGSSTLSPMREEDESMLVVEELDNDGKVFAAESFLPAPVPPLFSRPNPLHA